MKELPPVIDFWVATGSAVRHYQAKLRLSALQGEDEYELKLDKNGKWVDTGTVANKNLQIHLDKEWYRYPTPAYQKAHATITAQLVEKRKAIEHDMKIEADLLKIEEDLLEAYRREIHG